MGFLFELDTPVIVALVVSFYVAAGGQLLHVLFLSTRRGARPFSLVKLYEVLLFVHLLLAAATANSVHNGYGVALFRLKTFSLPIESLLWDRRRGGAFGACAGDCLPTPHHDE